ncbi:unnamed protein product [Cylicocyclus nassatus]|uniref:Globin domain-containing protein n=1 Tax=Cylicocyclus nassatus TaxID=53992 RepID=A0AA36DS73_CYLNA|nr:unnamed protein product [Cylicocyclus nassatus]
MGCFRSRVGVMTAEVVTEEVPRQWFCCGRCSMPSLTKMPSAARHLMSNMFSFFNSTSSTQPGSSDKVGAQFSTPQMDRKSRVNGTRRLSEGQTNGAVNNGKVDQGDNSAKQKKPIKWERLKIKNVEKWEPNVYEKELLRRTWSDDFEFLYDLGTSIYTYIFEHNPNCKQLFPQLVKYGDKFKESREFRSQALKFVQTISQVVKNIYHKERLEPFLYGVGQLHCKFASRGFKPEYWEIFQDAMEHSLAEHMNSLPDLDERQRSDAVTIWRTLALYIIAHMKVGYFDGLKAINKHPPLV